MRSKIKHRLIHLLIQWPQNTVSVPLGELQLFSTLMQREFLRRDGRDDRCCLWSLNTDQMNRDSEKYVLQ